MPAFLPVRHSMVARKALVRRLARSSASLVVIVAPAGYGKSTLLGQWAAVEDGVVYLRLDARHDDPSILLSDLVHAYRELLPEGSARRDTILTPALLGTPSGAAWFVEAVARRPEPIVLMLDDIHLLKAAASRDVLGWIVDRLAAPHRIVLAGRSDDIAGLPRARTRGGFIEVGAADLALDVEETASLAASEGIALTDAEARELHDQTGGWPVATYLAVRARAADQDAGRHARPFLRGQRALFDYMRSELLGPLEPKQRRWLVRCAGLPFLSGPLCDAALETAGSLRHLRAVARSNHLVIPTDEAHTRYQLHPLFAEFLQDEMALSEAAQAPRIAARAARWLEAHDEVAEGVLLAHASGDIALLASMVARNALPAHQQGRLASVDGWLAWIDRPEVQVAFPAATVVGAWAQMLMGRTDAALAWLAIAERVVGRDGELAGSVHALRAMLMPAGVERFLADVEAASAAIPASSPWVVAPATLAAIRLLVTGETDRADEVVRASLAVLRAKGGRPGQSGVLGIHAGIALDRGDLGAAAESVREGLAVIEAGGLQDYLTSFGLEATAARVALAQGRIGDARRHLAAVNRMRPQLMTSMPWLGVQARLHAIRACLALNERAAARVLLSEVALIRRARPDLGALDAAADEVRTLVAAAGEASAGPWALTNAELRLLAYLPTHLTLAEIAQRLNLSRNTVKTQTMSIYGKLEASSRREALERAVDAGLLAPTVLRYTDGTEAIA